MHLARETEHGTRNVFARMDAADAMRLMATIALVAKHLPDVDGETQGRRLARALGLLADPQAALDLLAGRDPRGGKAIVYVHTTLDQLTGSHDVARVEDLGPYTLRMLATPLGHSQITLKPVIDLDDGPAADSYEIPGHIAERVHLTQPADVYPWAVSTSRWLDRDHTRPYDSGGLPGQTSVENLGNLNRRHHRIKTHMPGMKVERLLGNRYLWTTPHGRHLMVDRHGTQRLDPHLRLIKHRLDLTAA